jgi:hypothetical protein
MERNGGLADSRGESYFEVASPRELLCVAPKPASEFKASKSETRKLEIRSQQASNQTSEASKSEISKSEISKIPTD